LFAKILEEEYNWRSVEWDVDLSFSHRRNRIKPFHNVEAPLEILSYNVLPNDIILNHFLPNDANVIAAVLRLYCGNMGIALNSRE
jgi:hypothetical protein